MTFRPISAIFVLPVMLLLIEAGRRFRIAHKAPVESTAIENAIFALFGLLLTFTFSGAVTRYDAHRQLVVEESNDIGTAYRHLDLLPITAQPELRQFFRDYTTSRLHLYDTVITEISPVMERLQREIWKRAAAAAAAPGANVDATKLLLPALNNMIAITATRQVAFNLHPPVIVFLLLFALAAVPPFSPATA
jgi:hypothetical protein